MTSESKCAESDVAISAQEKTGGNDPHTMR